MGDIAAKPQIYPNPASELITIDARDLMSAKLVELIDGSGKTIYSQEANFGNKLNIKHLPAGLHFIRITKSNGEIVSRKFVKR